MALPYWQRRAYDSIYVSAHHRAYREALDEALGKVWINAASARAAQSIVDATNAFRALALASSRARLAFARLACDAVLVDSACTCGACGECVTDETWN